MNQLIPAAAAALATIALSACGSDASAGPNLAPAGIIRGQSKPLGAGTASAWIRTDSQSRPTSLGVSFDDAALRNLGTSATEIVLALPALPNLKIRTAVIDWNPQAHVYDVPHFDFHFYTIDESTRMKVTGSGPAAAATPAAELVPAGFQSNGLTTPMMDYFAADQPEFHGGTFTATPIYGYWNGHLAFVESMITLDYLRSHPARSSAFAKPARFEQSGLYPTQWSATYDPVAHRYDIAFADLVAR